MGTARGGLSIKTALCFVFCLSFIAFRALPLPVNHSDEMEPAMPWGQLREALLTVDLRFVTWEQR